MSCMGAGARGLEPSSAAIPGTLAGSWGGSRAGGTAPVWDAGVTSCGLAWAPQYWPQISLWPLTFLPLDKVWALGSGGKVWGGPRLY